MNIVWKLLRKNISVAQLVGFVLANFVGLLIIVLGVQFYADVRSLWEDDDSFIKQDYLVINKRVSGSQLLTGGQAEFTPDEIKEIESQEWVRKVGRFSSADYKLYASVEQGGRQLSTSLFFESIPAEFIDVKDAEWSYKPGDKRVPIIISKEYLSLYNFGFASSTGMPQMSEGIIGAIPMRLRISTPTGMVEFEGGIVGFSNRLNTILVPQEFMDWSNQMYGRNPRESGAASRLIVDVNSPGDVRIAEYMNAHNYEVAGDKRNSTAAYFLNVVTGVIIAVGIVITLLSFFILLLSISLLMQKNREKMHSLIMLGYDLSAVAAPYHKIVVGVNLAAYLMAVAGVICLRQLYIDAIIGIGAESASVWSAITVGAVIAIGIVVFNIISINKKVKKSFLK